MNEVLLKNSANELSMGARRRALMQSKVVAELVNNLIDGAKPHLPASLKGGALSLDDVLSSEIQLQNIIHSSTQHIIDMMNEAFKIRQEIEMGSDNCSQAKARRLRRIHAKVIETPARDGAALLAKIALAREVADADDDGTCYDESSGFLVSIADDIIRNLDTVPA